MSFLETPRFPTDISYGSDGGPSYNTTVTVVSSGHEKRNSNWTYPRHNFNVVYGVKTIDLLEILIAFFHIATGKANGFRYKDYADYKSSGVDTAISDTDQTIAIQNSDSPATTAFQLIKTYTSGATTKARNITKPVDGTVVIALDGVPQTASPLGWSVDTTTGIVTFSTPPAAGVVITAGYEFDVPCRFDADTISSVFANYKVHSVNVPVIEIRV